MSRRARLLPALVVLGAALLRVWGLAQGLPNTSARPDERELLVHTVGFAAGDFNPHWFVYPNLYFWIVWLWDRLLLALGRLLGPTPGYHELLSTGLPTLILYGRLLSALVGTATVAVVYAIGRRLGGPALGVVAAFLLAVNYLHVRESHALKNEIWLPLGAVVAICALGRWSERRTLGDAMVSGIVIGLTTALMYAGALLGIAAWVADAIGTGRRGVVRIMPSGQLVLLGAVAIGVFLLGCPYLLLDWDGARAMASFASLAMYGTAPVHRPPPDAGLLETLVLFVRHRAFAHHLVYSLRYGCGLLASLCLPAAIVLAWRQPRRPALVLAAAFTLVFYLVAGASRVHLARYFVAVTPLVALLLGHLVLWAANGRTAVVTLLALALAAEPLAMSIAYDRIAATTDTRVLATRWMAEHLPPGAVVAQLGSGVFPIADPELPPGVVKAPLKPGEGDLARHGVTYVVTHEHQLAFSRLNPRFMQRLAPSLRLLAEFDPYRDGPAGLFESEDAYYVPFADLCGVVRPGPLVRVYAYTPS